jgi:hypothetical protein
MEAPMTRRCSPALIAIALACLLPAGCQSMPKDLVEVNSIKSMYDIDPGTMTKAPADGTYELWELRTASLQSKTFEVELKKGDRLGFMRSGMNPLAVAGDQQIYLHSAQGYGWFRDPGEADPVAATADAAD